MRRMTSWKRRALAILLAGLLCVFCLLPVRQAEAGTDGMVRVMLTRLGNPGAVSFRATCDYWLQSDTATRIPAGTDVYVLASGAEMTLRAGSLQHTTDGTLILKRGASGSQGVRFTEPSQQNLYCGDLLLAASDSRLAVILNIYIEDYLYGVVGYEMSPSWHIEALKAQAVAARNYVLLMMNSRSGAAYHVTDNTSNQVYKGLNTAASYAPVVRAVDETRGVVLYCDGEPARCYYSASNGGQTESTKNAWGTALKYSVVKDDPYDYTSGGVVRSADIARDASDLKPELRAALTEGVAAQMAAAGVSLAENGITLNGIEAIEAVGARYDAPSRLFGTLAFTVRATVRNTNGDSCTGSLTVNVPTYGGVESWYGLSINSGKTETVWVTETEAGFRISFRRNGHGVGLSQWGAQTMASQHGMSCEEILRFYYPGTTAQRLSLKDTSAGGLPEAAPGTDAAPEADAAQSAEIVVPDWEMYARAIGDATIHAAPEASSASLGTIGAGRYGRVQAYTRSWVLLEASGVKGFVAIDNLTPATAAEAQSIPEIPEAGEVPAETPAGTGVVIPDGDMYVCALEQTIVHSAADVFAGALGVMSEGERAQVLAYTRSWMLLETDGGVRGFVVSEALTPVPAWQAQAIPGFEPVSFTGSVRVCRASAALYERADESAAQLALLPYGTEMEAGEREGEWIYVRLEEQTGCVRSSDVTERSLTAKSAQDVIEANFYAETTARVSLYAGPGGTSESLGLLESGLRLEVHAYNDAYALVSVGQTYGFVEINWLKTVI